MANERCSSNAQRLQFQSDDDLWQRLEERIPSFLPTHHRCNQPFAWDFRRFWLHRLTFCSPHKIFTCHFSAFLTIAIYLPGRESFACMASEVVPDCPIWELNLERQQFSWNVWVENKVGFASAGFCWSIDDATKGQLALTTDLSPSTTSTRTGQSNAGTIVSVILK